MIENLAEFLRIQNPGEAELNWFLDQIKPTNTVDVMIADCAVMNGIDGYPYVAITVDPDNANNPMTLAKEVWINEAALTQGRGIMFVSAENTKRPRWWLTYDVLVTFALFGSVRLPRAYAAPDAWPLPPVAEGTKTLVRTEDDVLPDFLKAVVNKRLGALLGEALDLPFQTVEFPDTENAFRVRIDLGDRIKSADMYDRVLQELRWCLPYVVELGSIFQP